MRLVSNETLNNNNVLQHFITKIIAIEHGLSQTYRMIRWKRLHIYKSLTLHLYICHDESMTYLLKTYHCICDTNRYVSVNDILDLDHTLSESSRLPKNGRKNSQKNELKSNQKEKNELQGVRASNIQLIIKCFQMKVGVLGPSINTLLCKIYKIVSIREGFKIKYLRIL